MFTGGTHAKCSFSLFFSETRLLEIIEGVCDGDKDVRKHVLQTTVILEHVEGLC